MNEKKLLFSVTKDDCVWSYTKGTGAGGQKRNKTSNAVHCIHKPSGARGYSEESRSQLENRKDAFIKMINTHEFKKWHRIETMKKTGELKKIDEYAENELKNTKIEVKDNNGNWLEVDKSYFEENKNV